MTYKIDNTTKIVGGAIGALVGLYLLCRSGRLGSYGNTAKICRLFESGIPGFNFLGGGALVAVGSDTVSLSALLFRLKSSGIGSNDLNALQPGQYVPQNILPVGWRGVDRFGNRVQIEGYVLSGIFTNDGRTTLGYRVVRQDGSRYDYSAKALQPNVKYIEIV